MKDFLGNAPGVDELEVDEIGNIVEKTKETNDGTAEKTKDDTVKKDTGDKRDEETVPKGEKTEIKDDGDEKAGEQDKQEKPVFSFDSFKEYAKENFEREIESEEDLKKYFEKAAKADELESQISELEQRRAELETLASKGINGRDWFVSDDEFIRQQFLKNNGEKFGEAALSELSNLSPEKIKKLDPIEAIKVSLMIDNPDLEKSEVDALISTEYGLEGEPDEWDAASKAKMKVEANKAKKSLSELYNDIELPKAVDLESSRSELKESWDKPLSDIVKGIDKIQISEDLAFGVTDEMKDGMVESIMGDLLRSHTKPSEEAASEIAGIIRSRILEKNFDQVVEFINKNADEKAKAKYRQEVHNDTDLNNDTKPEEENDEIPDGGTWMKQYM